MITNETRARLNWRRAQLLAHGKKHTWAIVGLGSHETCAVCGLARFSAGQPQEAYYPWCSDRGSDFNAPQYDTDASAVAELRAFVRERGKENLFTRALDRQLTADTRGVSRFELLDATPAQQAAAFDTVFRDELERINENK